MFEYVVTGVVRDMCEEDIIRAKSEKQAWFLFAKKHKFRVRNFKVLRETNLDREKEDKNKNVQLSFLDII